MNKLPDTFKLAIEDKKEISDTSEKLDKTELKIIIALSICIYIWIRMMYGQ